MAMASVPPPVVTAVPSPASSSQSPCHGASSSKSQGMMLALQTLAGAGSGAVTKTATAPLERVKIIFQVQGMRGEDLIKPKYTGILQTFALVTREEGPLALWKGNGANVLRVIPVYGLKFSFNDSFKAIVAGPTRKQLSVGELLAVGTLSGLFQTIITYPLETLRTRLSLGAEQGGVRYSGIADCVRQMVRSEGWGSLYKGLVPTIISGAPYTGLQMTSYEIFKRNSPDGGHGVLWSLLNGSLSGLVAQTITYPGDTIRRRMQNNGAGGAARVYSSSWDCTVQTWKKEGVRGFFRGAWTNTVRAVPGAAIQFASYELIKKSLGC